MAKSKEHTGAAPQQGPLSGVKIVDLSTVVFGPYATMLLADMGAEVIKVETGKGDTMRHAGKAPAPGMGGVFMALNRNKRSVTLDLSKPASKRAFSRLLETADVFFHNVRSGGIKRLGFDYESVKSLNKDIIYVHGVGYGSQGLYGGRQAYDDLVQAASGFADLVVMRDGGDPEYVPSIVADKTAGLHATYATIAALFHRERTGQGQFVEVPMLEAFTMFNLVENLYRKTFLPPTGGMGYTRSINPNRKPYPTKDGFISIVPYNDEQWAQFFEVGGRAGVMDDPRFATYEQRTDNIGDLYAIIREVSGTKTTDEWLELLGSLNIPAMRYNKLDEVLEEPHLKSVGFFTERDHKNAGKYISMAHPVRFEQSPAEVRSDPEMLGESTGQVLKEIGLSDAEIELVAAESMPL